MPFVDRLLSPYLPRPLLAAALAWLPLAAGHAADAHRAVQAQPGDIVVLRQVPTRPADRQAPPGMALMVSPSPKREVTAALGNHELSEADYAGLDAASPTSDRMQDTAMGRSLEGMLVRGSGNSIGTAGTGVSSVVADPAGAVGRAAGGIGEQVQGALAQLPLGATH